MVIQWVTSKDNAGTSLNGSTGASHGALGRPATIPRDGHSPCRSFSPCLVEAGHSSPSTPTAEFSLTTTTHCCAQTNHSREYDAESCDSTLSATAAAKMLAAAEHRRPAVLVTTTIERATAPIGPLAASTPGSASSPRLPHKLLGRHRNSHVDTEVMAAASSSSRGAAVPVAESRRGSRGIVPWGAAMYMGGYPTDRRSP